MHGNTPCSKMTTFSFFSPKYLFSSKNFSVGPLVGPLVITYHGTMTLSLPCCFFASCCTFAIRSPWSWNSDLWLGSPISKQPLGAELPNRVPCPPAINTTATWFSAISFRPSSYHLSRSSAFESRTDDVALSGRGSILDSTDSVFGGWSAFSASSLMYEGSNFTNCAKRAAFSAVVSLS